MSEPNCISTPELIDMVNSVEVLTNLAYLIERNRHNPDDVLRCIRLIDHILKRMTSQIIQTHLLETVETSAV